MKTKLVYIILPLMLFFSCGKNKVAERVKFSEREQEIINSISTLKDVYKEKKVIKLNDAPQNGFCNHMITNGKFILAIYMFNGQFTVHVWDESGGYYGTAGAPGKGPGEYLAPVGLGFKNQDSFYIFDRAKMTMSFFQIENKSVKFVDQINLDALIDAYVDTMFVKNNLIYLISYSGPKGTFRVYVLDDKFNLEKKFLKRRFIPGMANPVYSVSDTLLYILEDYNGDWEMYEAIIYVCDLDGKYIREIDIGYKKVFDLNLDKSGKLLLVTSMENIYDHNKPKKYMIYDIYGNFLKEFKSFYPNENCTTIGGNRTSDNYEMLLLQRCQKTNESILHIYDIDLGLETSEEK